MARPANPKLVDDIVRVTAEMLEEGGVDSVTMRGVAERVGSSPTIIYHYFKNKDGLLHSAVRRGLEWFGSAVGQADPGGGGVERLRSVGRAYVRWGIENPAMYRLMFEQRLPRPAEGADLQQRRQGWGVARGMLAEVFELAGVTASDRDLDVAANLMFVSLHGIVSTAISGRLWGPSAEKGEIVRLSEDLVDELVGVWAESWGLESA